MRRLSLCRHLSSPARDVLQRLEIEPGTRIPGIFDGTFREGCGPVVEATDKATGEVLATVTSASADETNRTLGRAREAFKEWRMVPAPKRGEILRQIRNKLADNIDDLGALVSLEMGKIKSEGIGEVQEFIDIADQAVGLSRQLNGTVSPSERPGHMLMEVPHPLGVVGVVSAFNFPAAVYGWNMALSFVSGNSTVWAPSSTTPLISIAVTRMIASVLGANSMPTAVASLVCGGPDAGKALVASRDVELLSFTGSEAVGKEVAARVGSRLGKSLLELGGNNAAIVMSDADISLAVRTVTFGAIGTAGQRCTSTRRLFLHREIADQFLQQLRAVYAQIVPSRIGHPLSTDVLCGPLHSKQALKRFVLTVDEATKEGGKVVFGGKTHEPSDPHLRGGNFVEPTIILFEGKSVPSVMLSECFAPILFVKTFNTLEEAIALNNGVEQGLSSTIFTQDLANVFRWTGPAGSDTGIVNCNTSTSGAEIGAGFGGNKATGWGREAGGEAWRQYSRWSTCVLNYSGKLPLAQGVTFN